MNKTKLFVLLASPLLPFALSQAHGTIIAADGFLTPGNYEDSEDLLGQNPTITGFDGAWQQSSTFDRIRPTSAGISGFFQNEQAGGLTQDAAGSADRLYTRDLSESASNPLTTEGEYWAAHLIRITDLDNAGVRAGYTILGEGQDGPLRTYGIVEGEFSTSEIGNPNLSDITETINQAPQADTDYIFLSQVSFTTTGSGVAETMNIWALTRDQFEDWDQSEGMLTGAASWHWSDTNNSIIFNNGNDIRLESANIEFLSSNTGEGGFIVDELRYATSLDGLALIPEPSTYAALIGLLALAFVAYRRRK